ncbi:MAG: M42 family metallopeptidase [Firmicutes bacterium]|nr:M42 family metallopeptidase [Bacillota bacterium]
MEKHWPTLKEELMAMLRIPSPSGYTAKVNAYIEAQLQKLNVPYAKSVKGAITATLPGKDNERQRTLSAHIDTLGAMVKEIKSDGKLKLTNIGGLGWANVEGENCLILTSGGKEVSGTLLLNKASSHVHGQDTLKTERKAETMQVRLDAVVKSEQDARDLGIEVGDFVVFDPRTTETDTGFIKSRHLDDKAGVAIMLAVLKELKETNTQLPYTTNFFFSHYEEVGHGATAGLPEKTHEFLCIDMGAPGEGQQSDEFSVSICAKDSSGPYTYEFKEKLVKMCKEHNIPYQVDIYPYYGSDASGALRAGYDFTAALIGPGVDASHSYERTHKDSLLATAELTLLWCKSD